MNEDWQSLSLRNLCELKYGKSPKETVRTESGFPIVGTSGVVGYSEKPLFHAPLIMVGRKGTIDKPLFIQDDCWIIDTAYGLLADNSAADIKWLFYFLSNYGLGKLNEATGVPSLSRDNLYNIEVPTPPLAEQRKIAAILTSVDDAITATQRIIDQTEVVKRGLMQQLLTKGIGHTEFKQTEIGEIPTEWKVLTLGELLEKGMILGHQDGNHGELYPRSEEFADEGVPYLAANCIIGGQVDLSLAKFLPMERASKFKKGVAKNEDVLFAHNATVGPVLVLKTDLDFVVLSTTLTYYRCNTELIHPYYLVLSQ